MTEPLSVRAHRAAMRMWDGNPIMAQPQLEDYRHLDHTPPGPHAGPPAAQAPSQPSAEPLSVRAYRAAQHMYSDSPGMRKPTPEDFAHLDGNPQPPPADTTTTPPDDAGQSADPPAPTQAQADFDGRVRAALAAMASQPIPSPPQADPPAATRTSARESGHWMQ